MTQRLDTFKEIHDASNALLDWFKSQDILPQDAMVVISLFVAYMTTANAAADGRPIEHKLELFMNSVREFIQVRKITQ